MANISEAERAEFEAKQKNAIAAAACVVIARDGMHKASLRAIAKEMGCTTGMVTHYFANKEAILVEALERLLQPLVQNQPILEGPGDDLESLIRQLVEVLPLDGPRIQFWKVWSAFMGLSITNLTLQARRISLLEDFRQRLSQSLSNLMHHGMLDAPGSAEDLADGINAYLGGLGLTAVAAPSLYPPERVRSLAIAHLRRLFNLPTSPV